MKETIRDKRANTICIMRELAVLASTSAVRWEWLENYAKGHPVCYPSDFVEEAKEVLRHERTEK